MSEYWKSTPKYWCKHCACYVRDTKLERQNHEATGKHQGALKRFLRDLHRGHEREERDKERAQREIARLNGVVAGSSASDSSAPTPRTIHSSTPGALAGPSESQLKRQREQLAELGVTVPTDFLPDMAMPGQWTVTNTRVIKDESDGQGTVEAKATGIRKREVPDDEKEEEEAIRGLFKKRRGWGRDSKTMPHEGDEELDALLSVSTFQPPISAEQDEDVKKENNVSTVDKTKIKVEDTVLEEETGGTPMAVKAEISGLDEPVAADKSEELGLDPPIKTEEVDAAPGLNPVVFKKRKPKNIRQK
ncbi:hypothetical protein G7046_g593 [Stylonectria norvegica]|nr:hypothetical protein G7046_g593 [Stylonectria norvegica]